MLSITRYRNTRYWALWEGGQLLAVTVYKKGIITAQKTGHYHRLKPEPEISVSNPPRGCSSSLVALL